MYHKHKVAAFLAFAVFTYAAYASVPQVSNVTMKQIEHTRNVQITYDLAVTNAIITLAIDTNGVALPDSLVITLTGDINKNVEIGEDKEIIWQAGRDWPENRAESVRARVTAWSENNPPQYCVVDLTPVTSTINYPVHYFVNSDSVPQGITDDIYKKQYLILCLIEPTKNYDFWMGSPDGEPKRISTDEEQVKVVLTKPFYMGVYQVTQRQWAQIMGLDQWPSRFNHPGCRDTRPVEVVSYNKIRGSTEGAKWPGSVPGGDHSVDSTSFMGILREKTGIDGFDLPTEAQWEWACRAGTIGAYNVTNAVLADLGRYIDNGGRGSETGDDTERGTNKVGSYLPNAWGLYDMHGNVYEWCLNWFSNEIYGGSDPVGATIGSERVSRGGFWNAAEEFCRSAYRYNKEPSYTSYSYSIGLRVARHLP